MVETKTEEQRAAERREALEAMMEAFENFKRANDARLLEIERQAAMKEAIERKRQTVDAALQHKDNHDGR